MFGIAAGDAQPRVLPERFCVSELVRGEQDDIQFRSEFR